MNCAPEVVSREEEERGWKKSGGVLSGRDRELLREGSEERTALSDLGEEGF